MGGGVGVSMHGSHVVASEKTMFAMPETAIGLFPDVGGGWLLGQLDKGIGAWLSLVGARIKAYDLMKLKLITHYVSSSEIGNLKKKEKLSGIYLLRYLKKSQKNLKLKSA